MGLTFITGVKFYKDILEQLNHITYIYDPNWSADNFAYPTFPVCFFHVKSMHEVMTSEVSHKQMLFYNSKGGDIDNSTSRAGTDAGILNVVADNIVIKPKSYKLDVIIPYQDLSLLNQSFIFNSETMAYITSKFARYKGDTRTATAISSMSTLCAPVLKFCRDLIRSLLTANFGTDDSVDGFVTSVMASPDYNKNSLEAMWRLRRILKMKVWNSWTYKYVAITDIDITKEGTENGVYEATITVQEVPIATLKDKKDSGTQFKYNNPLLKFQSETAIKLLDNAGTLLGE